MNLSLNQLPKKIKNTIFFLMIYSVISSLLVLYFFQKTTNINIVIEKNKNTDIVIEKNTGELLKYKKNNDTLLLEVEEKVYNNPLKGTSKSIKAYIFFNKEVIYQKWYTGGYSDKDRLVIYEEMLNDALNKYEEALCSIRINKMVVKKNYY